MDPTNRVWMREEDSYLPAIRIGDVVRAAGLGEVVESRRDGYHAGDLVMGLPGWQDYWTLTSEDDTGQVVPPGIPVEDMLSIYGGTGVTAYFGLLEIGRPQPGETVVVSGAAGGVGSVAGQIARIKDAGRVVGIAGTDEKCRWVVEDLGFDACINYKTEDVGARLRETCPDGIDVFFDNVGGEILDAVLLQINIGARIVMCGAISEYNRAESAGLKNYTRADHAARAHGGLHHPRLRRPVRRGDHGAGAVGRRRPRSSTRSRSSTGSSTRPTRSTGSSPATTPASSSCGSASRRRRSFVGNARGEVRAQTRTAPIGPVTMTTATYSHVQRSAGAIMITMAQNASQIMPCSEPDDRSAGVALRDLPEVEEQQVAAGLDERDDRRAPGPCAPARCVVSSAKSVTRPI